MAATKLNPEARPFHRSSRLHLSPLPPPPTTAYQPLPLVPSYPCAPFPEYHYPLPPPYLLKGGVPLPPLAPPLAPPPPPPPPFLRKHVPLPPHGSRPRTLMFPSRGSVVVKKLCAQALAKAQAHAAAPRSRRPTAPPRGQRAEQQARIRGRSKDYVPVVAGAESARSPSPVFTARPASPMPAPAWLGRRTTVMIRNIPNRLTRAGMMELLDDHCARANRRRGSGRRAVTSAYDFLYVPMDFSTHRSSNKGYAFVNFTTAAAARGLHDALHGCRWKPSLGSKKTIHIDAAHIQGKEALVRHFSVSTFACHSDDLLPAVFSPPRDGTAEPSAAEPSHVGRRVTPRPLRLAPRRLNVRAG